MKIILKIKTVIEAMFAFLNIDTKLILIDLGLRKERMGGSIYMQTHSEIGDISPDLDNPKILVTFFEEIQKYHKEQAILAYHDRSDGGVITTLAEMSFASNVGLTIFADTEKIENFLFNVISDPIKSISIWSCI